MFRPPRTPSLWWILGWPPRKCPPTPLPPMFSRLGLITWYRYLYTCEMVLCGPGRALLRILLLGGTLVSVSPIIPLLRVMDKVRIFHF